MRGVYQAAYLDTFVERLRESEHIVESIDIGRAFDLVVGTSTGGIVACALAAGIPLQQVRDLYAKHGKHIFPLQWARAVPVLEKFVRGLGVGVRCGDLALRSALTEAFGNRTVGSVYAERKIALAITSLDLNRHASVVFKSQHLKRLRAIVKSGVRELIRRRPCEALDCRSSVHVAALQVRRGTSLP
ncbi:MAG: patatin-like phospholipase family protein [Burkholderiales bacterium]|nr:patatin-like phospholipase family protein [Burkholderiales bacterium]